MTETLPTSHVDLKLTIRAYSNYLFAISCVTIEDEKECTKFEELSSRQAFYDCQSFISKLIEQFGLEKATSIVMRESGNDGVLIAPYLFALYRIGDDEAFSGIPADILSFEESSVLILIASDFPKISCKHINGRKSPMVITSF